MNKIKFGFLSLVVALGLVSCNGNDYEYTPAQEAGQYNIGFGSDENMILDLSVMSTDITITREDDSEEQTIPLNIISCPDCISVPESVTFEQGSKTATITLTFSEDMLPNENYKVEFSIPEEYTQPYTPDAKSPVFSVLISKQDYEVVATCTWYDQLYFGPFGGLQIQYSPTKNLYRIRDMFVEGYDVYFFFDYASGAFYFTEANGQHIKKVATGDTYGSYGMVYMNILENNPMGYVESEEGNYFKIPLQFAVDAGALTNAAYCYIDEVEWIKKPWEENTEEE